MCVIKCVFIISRKIYVQWVFGSPDTSQSPAMEVVHQWDAAILMPINQAHVALGTEVHIDQWAAYNQVSNLLIQRIYP